MDFKNSVMCLLSSVTKIDGRQERENKSLQESHKQLQEEHENHEGSRKQTDAVASNRRFPALPKDENQTCEGQNDDVTSRDVRRQTNHQNKWFEQKANDFNRCQNDQNPFGHTRHGKNVTPVMLVPTETGDQKHERRQNHGDPKGARDVEPPNKWNQPQQIRKEDEEEHRHRRG